MRVIPTPKARLFWQNKALRMKKPAPFQGRFLLVSYEAGSDPGAFCSRAAFERFDGRAFFHGQADIIQAFHQAFFAEWIQLKRNNFTIRGSYGLVFQIHHHSGVFTLFSVYHQQINRFLR